MTGRAEFGNLVQRDCAKWTRTGLRTRTTEKRGVEDPIALTEDWQRREAASQAHQNGKDQIAPEGHGQETVIKTKAAAEMGTGIEIMRENTAEYLAASVDTIMMRVREARNPLATTVMTMKEVPDKQLGKVMISMASRRNRAEVTEAGPGPERGHQTRTGTNLWKGNLLARGGLGKKAIMILNEMHAGPMRRSLGYKML
mmetsp:Transcript_22636/g.47519  ORF Transcript_22636/g.47519 Transcript_22636/m.47519 type:complete len:199 (+) Transcript_22636:1545-2141(+)